MRVDRVFEKWHGLLLPAKIQVKADQGSFDPSGCVSLDDVGFRQFQITVALARPLLAVVCKLGLPDQPLADRVGRSTCPWWWRSTSRKGRLPGSNNSAFLLQNSSTSRKGRFEGKVWAVRGGGRV